MINMKDIEPFSEKDIKTVIEVLLVWAKEHPKPNKTVIGFAGHSPLSPLQLVQEVIDRTPNGRSFIKMLRLGTEVMPLSEILKSFARRPLLSL